MYLANILLTFIFRELIEKDEAFKRMYHENLKIWQRFIDDCLGMFLGGRRVFSVFYDKLLAQFKTYDLDLTMEMSDKEIIMLDLEIYVLDNRLHTKESRKETASNSYLHYQSAHPTFTFMGIVKSQMYRLRRLCSRDEDYKEAIQNLKKRCLNSGYDEEKVDSILNEADNVQRSLTRRHRPDNQDISKIRWVTLAHSVVEDEIENYVKETNTSLKSQNVCFELIKTTAPTLGKMVFNNNNSTLESRNSCKSNCHICSNEARGDEKKVKCSKNNEQYNIDDRTTCNDSGIYLITCKCKEQYVGKTTVTFQQRFKEHCSKKTAVKEHINGCPINTSTKDVEIQLLENVWSRGKYSLSEREYLWNRRLKGDINIQKTLKTCT